MTITFYACTAEPERLDKTSYLTQKATYTTANPNKDLSIINPVLIIEEAIAEYILASNYCYISDFGRYYFIDRITANTAKNLYTLEMHLDVLYTYKEGIKLLNGCIERQEKAANYYINDNELATQSRRRYLTKEFPSGFDNKTNYTKLLMTLGGS